MNDAMKFRITYKTVYSMENSHALLYRAVLWVSDTPSSLWHEFHPSLFRFHAWRGLKCFVSLPDDVSEYVCCLTEWRWTMLATHDTLITHGPKPLPCEQTEATYRDTHLLQTLGEKTGPV